MELHLLIEHGIHKKIIFFTFLLLTSGLELPAQTIQAIRIDPPNPTELDPITVYIDQVYTSAPCDLIFENHAVTGSSIEIDVFHCPGILTVICPVTDTIHLGMLVPGTYQVSARSYIGGAAPCTGIVPGDSMMTSFNVMFDTGINENRNQQSGLFYSQTEHSIYLDAHSGRNFRLELYNGQGQLILSQQLNGGGKLFLPELSSGLYFYRLNSAEGRSGGKLVIGR